MAQRQTPLLKHLGEADDERGFSNSGPTRQEEVLHLRGQYVTGRRFASE